MPNICKVKRKKRKNKKSFTKLIIPIKSQVCLTPKNVDLQLLCMLMMMMKKRAKSPKHSIGQTMNSTNDRVIPN